MFSIETLPVGHGDALPIEYGNAQSPTRILIDAGTPAAYKAVGSRLKALQAAAEKLEFELLVITYIDDAHIGGVLEILENKEIDIAFNDFWFNG